MANILRKQVIWGCNAPIDTATVVAIGDLVYLDTGEVKPMESTPDDTDAATTRANFKDTFLGISADRSLAGETTDIQVEREGVMDLTLDSATTLVIGDLIGPYYDTDHLVAQTFTKVSTVAEAIGVVNVAGTSLTVASVLVKSTKLGTGLVG